MDSTTENENVAEQPPLRAAVVGRDSVAHSWMRTLATAGAVAELVPVTALRSSGGETPAPELEERLRGHDAVVIATAPEHRVAAARAALVLGWDRDNPLRRLLVTPPLTREQLQVEALVHFASTSGVTIWHPSPQLVMLEEAFRELTDAMAPGAATSVEVVWSAPRWDRGPFERKALEAITTVLAVFPGEVRRVVSRADAADGARVLELHGGEQPDDRPLATLRFKLAPDSPEEAHLTVRGPGRSRLDVGVDTRFTQRADDVFTPWITDRGGLARQLSEPPRYMPALAEETRRWLAGAEPTVGLEHMLRAYAVLDAARISRLREGRPVAPRRPALPPRATEHRSA